MTDFHPFDPFIPENANMLIIGTIPPHRFCKPNPKLQNEDVNFYYGSKDNYFWGLLSEICKIKFLFKNTFESVIQRKIF